MEDSLGKLLSVSRLKQGISVSEVAKTTRINEKFIRSLEEDRFDALPGDVITKGFLRTYAYELGLDGNAIIEKYDALHIEHEDMSPKWISLPLKKEVSRTPYILITLVILSMIAYGLYYSNIIQLPVKATPVVKQFQPMGVKPGISNSKPSPKKTPDPTTISKPVTPAKLAIAKPEPASVTENIIRTVEPKPVQQTDNKNISSDIANETHPGNGGVPKHEGE